MPADGGPQSINWACQGGMANVGGWFPLVICVPTACDLHLHLRVTPNTTKFLSSSNEGILHTRLLTHPYRIYWHSPPRLTTCRRGASCRYDQEPKPRQDAGSCRLGRLANESAMAANSQVHGGMRCGCDYCDFANVQSEICLPYPHGHRLCSSWPTLRSDD